VGCLSIQNFNHSSIDALRIDDTILDEQEFAWILFAVLNHIMIVVGFSFSSSLMDFVFVDLLIRCR
jgi:hypothetical protein